MNKLDLEMHSQNGTHSHLGDLLHLMPLDCPLKNGYDGVYVMCILPQSKEFFLNVRLCSGSVLETEPTQHARELDGAGRGSEDDSEGSACVPGT